MPPVTLRSFAESALTLLLPIECAGCQTPDTRLCAHCNAQLIREQFAADTRERPVDAPFPVFAAVPYAGIARQCILNFKEMGRTDMHKPLASLLELAVRDVQHLNPTADLWCVPMPSTRRNEVKRGFNHIELLMRRLTARPTPQRWLRASSTRADQVGLTVAQRQHNSRNSIEVDARLSASGALAGKTVLLIDDIATTGASLRAAQRALDGAGAHVLAAAVVAHTPKLAEA